MRLVGPGSDWGVDRRARASDGLLCGLGKMPHGAFFDATGFDMKTTLSCQQA